MKTKLSLCLLITIIGLCIISYQSASAQAVVEKEMILNEYFSDAGYLAPLGNYVVEGQVTMKEMTTITPSGRTHTKIQTIMSNVKGMYTDIGVPFVGSLAANDVINFSDSEGEETVTYEFKSITKGTTENVVFSVTAHITVNANGEITVLFERVRTKLVG